MFGWMSMPVGVTIAFYCFMSVGFVKLFQKCGISVAWAFVPIARMYKLSLCADMVDDGKVLSLVYIVLAFTKISDEIFQTNELYKGSTMAVVNLLIQEVFYILQLIYIIKIYLGLCKMFNRPKKWVVAFFFMDALTIFIWGISPKFVPNYKAGIKKKYVGSSDVDVLREGLTVNINQRVAGGFIHKKTLLRDIHMTIKPGRMVLLLGGSGAGKTTFINALTGYEKADATINLDGQDVYRDFNRMKYEIGFVPQQDLIRYNDTVHDTLMDAAFLRLPKNFTYEQRKKRVDEVMDIFGLTPVKDSLVGKQSGGQKKRISIASEFISDPSFYVLDEPDSGLDGILARELMKRLHEISRNGKIVMVITHSPDRVIECFDDVIVLAKDKDHIGRLVYYGEVDKAKEFFGKNTMEEIVKMINREEEGGEGKADELIEKFGGVCNA